LPVVSAAAAKVCSLVMAAAYEPNNAAVWDGLVIIGWQARAAAYDFGERSKRSGGILSEPMVLSSAHVTRGVGRHL
jgi:hypothetical protein